MVTSTNRAYVKSNECKSQHADATVFINKISDLFVTKTSNCNRFQVYKIINYTIKVKNNGPSEATGVILRDILPTTVTLDNIALSKGCYILKGRYITCYLGSINNGEEVTINLDVIPLNKCPIINSVFVIGNEFDPNRENNVDSLKLYHVYHEKSSDCDIYRLILVLIALYIIYNNS